ncbi:MAG: hypothetical protein Q8Q05_01585 [bacterium]|nr:hypothetical protein [bacterium]
MHQKLAKLVSLLTNPALVVSVSVVMILSRYADTAEKFWQGSVIGIGLLVLPGIIYSIYIWRKEGAVDLDLTERHDRIVPLMLSTLGAVIGSFLVQSKLQNATFTEMSYILVTMLAALTVVTTVWKISLHAATIAGLSSLLVVYQGVWFVLGYLVLIPVIWSRLELKQHSPKQLMAGTILGAGLTLVAAWFFSHYR